MSQSRVSVRVFLSVFWTCSTKTRSTINIVAATLLMVLIKAVYSLDASTCQYLANQVIESREMASYQPLLYQPTPAIGCRYSILYAQHHLLTKCLSICSIQNSISPQVPRCLVTLQAHEARSLYEQVSQPNENHHLGIPILFGSLAIRIFLKSSTNFNL